MGGFTLPEQTAKLEFEGDYAGAWVRVKTFLPLGEYLAEPPAEGDLPPLNGFAGMLSWLVEWNLGDAAGPIPLTEEGLKRVHPNVLNAIFRGRNEAIAEVPAPLARRSGDGAT